MYLDKMSISKKVLFRKDSSLSKYKALLDNSGTIVDIKADIEFA